MKYLTTTISLFALLLFNACEGPQGDPGPQGPPGEPAEVGFVMQWSGFDFTASNDYRVLLEFSEFTLNGEAFQALEDEVVLVFLDWSSPTDDVTIWRSLPQTLIVEEGLLQYNYDFSRFDVEIFLDADFDLSTLPADDTDNWRARVVVLPAEALDSEIIIGGRKATTEWDYETLVEKFGLPEPVVISKTNP